MLKGVVNPIPSVDGVTDGYVPTASGGTIVWAAQTGGGGGSGTVTSVAMTVPTGLTVSGTPITSSGTFAVALDTGYVIPTQATLDGKATSAQGALADSALQPNAPITGATKTKVTYDANGLVTAGADATTADIADSTNKRYVTDAHLTVLGNTSGTNTGDQDLSGLVPYTGATANVDLGTFDLLTDTITSKSSSGLILEASGGDDVLHIGNGGGVNATAYGGWNFDGATANTIASFGASKTLSSLSTATYPDLTELSYVKGVTSAIQTQLNAKAALATPSFTTTIGVGAATAAASGAGITFPATQSASTNANTLDDYEEGTWTPTIIGTTTPGANTYSQQHGRYVKIGKMVYCFVYVQLTAKDGAMAGSFAQVSGLPFTSATQTSARWGGFMNDWGQFSANQIAVGLQIQSSAAVAYITLSPAAASAQALASVANITSSTYLGGTFCYEAST